MSRQILAVIMDGCSANRKLIKLHSSLSDVTYQIPNPYTVEKGISDPPHLIRRPERFCTMGMSFVHYYHMYYMLANSWFGTNSNIYIILIHQKQLESFPN